jgi:Spy/CpxP family protein refolding chaperone
MRNLKTLAIASMLVLSAFQTQAATTQWADFVTDFGWTTQVKGDFNGDGRGDIANFHPVNGKWWVGLSNGFSF